VSKEKPITTMIVGLGRIGWKHHIREAAKNPHFRVTAAVDIVPERRKEAEKTYGCKAFATLDEALDARLAELAVICTRSIDHCEHTVKALERGCHVFLEKPAAMNAKEMDKMIAAARKRRRIFTLNQSLRATEDFRYVRELIDSKLLGRIFWIRRSGHDFYRRNDWQMEKRYGGGYYNNAGSHITDGLVQLTDSEIVDVWGDLKHTGVSAGDADDFARVSIRTSDGRLLEFDGSYSCAFPQPGWLICGTCGSCQIEGNWEKGFTARLKYFDPKKAPERKLEGPVPAGRKYRIREKLRWIKKTLAVKAKKPFPDWYDNLYKAIRKGAKPIVSSDSVRMAVWVMDQVRKASQWKY
jgi:scyllo-inositol 2-dehydrogenase (NADP+)